MKKPKKKKTAAKKSPKANSGAEPGKSLREHLVNLLKGGSAHIQFMDAVDGFPPLQRGSFAPGLPHTGWQLLEHVRIAQLDILEFSRNPKHVSPDFPDGYWPKTPGPQTDTEWENSLQAFQRDLAQMIHLVENPRTDLYTKISHGQGQTVLRQALVLADHNSYHIGQLVDLRRALGAWPES